MAVLYVLEQGAKLRRKGSRVVVEKDDEVISDVPGFKLDQVVIYGNVSFTVPMLDYLLKEQVGVSFLSMRGKLKGHLWPAFSNHGTLRRLQFRATEDACRCLDLSKSFVHGKVHNQRILLQRHRRRKGIAVLDGPISALRNCLSELHHADSLNEVRGLEGQASAIYFSGLRELIPGEFAFPRRSRRPPRDAFNALLSLGYSLLLNNVWPALESAGLDPYQGFLHADRYGRPSLALDLMEEWRPELVDSLVVSCLNKGIFGLDDFREQDGSVLLGEKALKEFISQYNQRLFGEFLHPDRDTPVNHLVGLQLQARRLVRDLRGERPYRPYLSR